MAKKSTVKPIDVESKYAFNELFFSKTDFIGNILTGNNVFIRVSQFTKEELIGSPHNIIRHPDMPRIVFKVLWDYLKAGKIIIAYVKNMSKEGRYYWVLATVFPVADGYLSIRMKPSSDYFKLIPDLYKSVLAEEEANGMNAALELLLGAIQSKGFKDYDSFMTKVMIEELVSVQKMIKAEKGQAVVEKDQNKVSAISSKDDFQAQVLKILSTISYECLNINEEFDHLFQDFENLLKIENKTNTTTSSVLDFSDKISILSLNSSIETYRLGEQGLTLSVIAKEIKKSSGEIETYTSDVVHHSKDISSQTQRLGLMASTSRLQSNMVNFFGAELLDQARQGKIQDTELKGISANISLLLNNFIATFSEVNNILNPLKSKINEIVVSIELINKITENLERSDVLGSIESSRIGDEGVKFSIVFTQLRQSTEKTKLQLKEFNRYLKGVVGTIDNINNSNLRILKYVEEIQKCVKTLQMIEKKKEEEQLAKNEAVVAQK